MTEKFCYAACTFAEAAERATAAIKDFEKVFLEEFTFPQRLLIWASGLLERSEKHD